MKTSLRYNICFIEKLIVLLHNTNINFNMHISSRKITSVQLCIHENLIVQHNFFYFYYFNMHFIFRENNILNRLCRSNTNSSFYILKVLVIILVWAECCVLAVSYPSCECVIVSFLQCSTAGHWWLAVLGLRAAAVCFFPKSTCCQSKPCSH